jgi:soluble calcium-activated nucleotidase 1
MACQGALVFDAASNKYTVEWDNGPDAELRSGHGEEGRGMELSELVLWNNRLYTADDRTGIVFEIVDFRTKAARVVPRFIFMEGDGNTDKGFKTEWMTVKDDQLVVASFGKEYANMDGTIKNYNNNWVVVVNKDGRCGCVAATSVLHRCASSPRVVALPPVFLFRLLLVWECGRALTCASTPSLCSSEHQDWSDVYNRMRKAAGYEYPAYILHETGLWSDTLKKWVFLPRRMCKEAYDEVCSPAVCCGVIVRDLFVPSVAPACLPACLPPFLSHRHSSTRSLARARRCCVRCWTRRRALTPCSSCRPTSRTSRASKLA